MVITAPPLPGRDPAPPPLKPIKVGSVARAYMLLNTFTPEQQAELYIWLAERPLPNIDPIRLALASTNALHEDELALFINALRKSMEPELWELLTTL